MDVCSGTKKFYKSLTAVEHEYFSVWQEITSATKCDKDAFSFY